jgi:cyclase
LKKKRIIPVILLRNGNIVQSKGFSRYQNIGNPLASVKKYSEWTSDELIYLDISSRENIDEKRVDLGHISFNNYDEIIDEVSKVTFMPITVGGGIKTNNDIQKKLQIGADKVSINTEALLNPKFINDAAKEFGSQCIVASVDVKKIDGKYFVYNKKFKKNLLVTEWVKTLEELGAGEILLNSVDRDGLKTGYDIDLINKVCNIVNLPVIALGGAGKVEDFKEVLENTDVDAVAAANFFQYIDQSVFLTRKYLFDNNLNVRKPNLK